MSQLAAPYRGALLTATNDNEIFIAGGAEIYSQALCLANRLYLTRIDFEFHGDTHFPQFEKSEWKLVKCTSIKADKDNPYPYRFLLYERNQQVLD